MALPGHRPSPDDGVMSSGCGTCLCRLVTDKEQNRGVDKHEMMRSMKKREHQL